MSKSKEPRDQQINLRLTATEMNLLKERADNQETSVTTYILNNTLLENNLIFSKEFRDTMENLNYAVSNLPKNSTPEQQKLEMEVHKLWQSLL